MLTLFANMLTHFADSTLAVVPLLAQTGRTYGFSWAIVLFLMILGLLVTLSPARRSYEVKKPKDE